MPKLWMGGIGTLCAIAHYRAALFNIYAAFPESRKNPSVFEDLSYLRTALGFLENRTLNPRL